MPTELLKKSSVFFESQRRGSKQGRNTYDRTVQVAVD
ncbi:MAG: hypothetical protein JWN40_3788 [Phycisphaerales bacterium]|nr:hypothetical protein [Phycisphaerales bacterium]